MAVLMAWKLILITLLLGCLLSPSDADLCHETFPPCPLKCQIDDRPPPGFTDAHGDPLPLVNYGCTSDHLSPCAVDIFNLTDSHTQDGTPPFNLKLDITCKHPHSRIIIANHNFNSRGDIVTFLMVRNCDIYWKDLQSIGTTFGLKVLYLVDSRDEFASGQPDYFDCVELEESVHESTTQIPHAMTTSRNETDDMKISKAQELQDPCTVNQSLVPLAGLRGVGSFGILNFSPASLSPVINSHLWPALAEIQFKGITDADSLHCLRHSMPNLQAIELLGPAGERANNIPAFPWTDEPMALPWGLSRTQFLHDHYATSVGIRLPNNLYRRIYTFDDYTLGNLSDLSLQGHLDLIRMRGCGITEVNADTFSNVTNLQVLDLESNMLKHVPDGLFQGLTSLRHLNLRNNHIATLPLSTFQTASTLESLNLGVNKLTRIDDFMFEHLSSVQSIDLSKNTIDFVSNYATGSIPQSSKLQRLRAVILNNNNISSVPTWVFYTRYLGDIQFANNSITLDGFTKTLSELSSNLIRYGSGYSVSSEDNIYQPNMEKKIDLRNNPLEKFDMQHMTDELLLNFKLLLNYYELDVRNTGMHCDCTMLDLQEYFQDVKARDNIDYNIIGVNSDNYDNFICYAPAQVYGQRLIDVPNTTFYCPAELENCPVSCSCYVRAADHTVIVNCTGLELTTLPLLVPDLTVDLIISHNKLKELPSILPEYVRSLQRLDLSNNKIHKLDNRFVSFVSNLDELLLHTNQLTNLPQQIEHLPGDVSLTLGDNHYLCDCNAKWLKYWMLGRIRQITDIDKVICAAGVPQSKLLIEANDSEFVCVIAIGTVVASVLGTFVALALMISIPAYIYRGEIKVFLFMRFNWHPFDRTDDSDVINKDFDAFVSYSHHDGPWVYQQLRPYLEDEEPAFRLCIHERDFMAGAAIAENIACGLKTSRRMILVLSKAFLRSDWCHHEFRQAHYKVTKERTNYLIVVLCEDVSAEDLDEDMLLYLKTNTYLSRDSRWFWDKLRYAMPQKPLLKILADKNMLAEPPGVVGGKIQIV